ncbi:MAG: 4a-hydroxytetrahydrobiopterin dehydratase [bacterium]|nr:4a-hydroxytetrahydrobiopterin dehydratase [bacterium]
MDLLNKKCVPCEGGTEPLTGEQIAEYFQALTGWQVKEEKYLTKEYQGKDFAEALAFVNAIGALAEAEGHHPDINLHSWNKVTLTLSTHAIGGLSINDFILAAKIDALKQENFPTIT